MRTEEMGIGKEGSRETAPRGQGRAREEALMRKGRKGVRTGKPRVAGAQRKQRGPGGMAGGADHLRRSQVFAARASKGRRFRNTFSGV